MGSNVLKALKISCTGAAALPLGELVPFQGELKTLSDEDYGRLKKSLLKHGFNFPFFVWRADGKSYTLDGHQRLKALGRLEREGYAIPKLPVAFVEASSAKEAKEKILLISSQYGRMTEKSLAGFLADADLQVHDLLDTIRLPEIDLSKLLDETSAATAEPEAKEDQAEKLRQKWGTATSQLWQAGDHRVFCGDSTNPDHVATLLEGAKPFIMVTDPPYGVKYDAAWRDKAAAAGHISGGAGATGKVANDNNASWRRAYELFPGAVVYVWHASAGAVQFALDLTAASFEIRTQIIWRKPIRNHGGQEDHVYDPFLGSGTTLVAAERLRRRLYAVELDPAYVAITLERASDMGLRPRLISGPQTAKSSVTQIKRRSARVGADRPQD